MMRIVLSGGWGYKNLGDDAILDSTIKLLTDKYQDCIIDVLTYDVEDSRIHSASNINLCGSAHSYLDLNVSNFLYPEIESAYTIPVRVYCKIIKKIADSLIWYNIKSISGCLRNVEDVIKSADIYIMCGGGYFNEKWLSKVRANIAEINIAKKYNIPVYIFGPTIGSFDANMSAKIAECFSYAKKISVRDESSYSQVRQYRCDVTLIPDVALSTWINIEKINKNKTIGLIFTNPDAQFQEVLVDSLVAFMSLNPEWELKLFLSRLWKYDFVSVKKLQKRLLIRGVDAEIFFPASFKKLETGLSSCQLVISENLHGLILAARNLVPIIAINDYAVGSPNYKKFVSFLKQSDSEKYFFNKKNPPGSIALLINEILSHQCERIEKFSQLRNVVKDKNNAFISFE